MLNILLVLTGWAKARRLTPHGKQSIERKGRDEIEGEYVNESERWDGIRPHRVAS